MAFGLVDISLATEIDIPAMAAIPPQAMQPDIIGRFMFRDPNDQMLPVMLISGELKHHLCNPNATVFKASLAGTGEIVGYATVTFKDGKETSSSGPASRLPPGMNEEFCRMHFGAMAERYTKHMSGKGEHAVWNNLFVKPEWQGKGIGKELLRWGFENLHLEKCPIWLNTMLAHSFYRQFGWEEVDVVDVDLSQWAGAYRGFGVHRLYCLLRQPGRLERTKGASEK